MDNGWIKLHRSLLSSDIMCRPKVLPVWIYILLSAAHVKSHVGVRDGSIEIEPGQVFISMPELAQNTKLSKQNIRTSLKCLISTCRITCKATRSGMLISVVNWRAYQDFQNETNTHINTQVNTQLTRSQHAYKNKECKNVRNNKNIPNIAEKNTPEKSTSEVDEIYRLYPTKCPVGGRSTGKGAKDKAKIAKVLKTGYPLKAAVAFYIGDCKRSGVFLKNFSTFLNNLPDPDAIMPINDKKTGGKRSGNIIEYPNTKNTQPVYLKPLPEPEPQVPEAESKKAAARLSEILEAAKRGAAL